MLLQTTCTLECEFSVVSLTFFVQKKSSSFHSDSNDFHALSVSESPGGRKQHVKNVDEFVPEGELDDQFFNDDEASNEGARTKEEGEETESDEDYNPQVAIDEDLSSPEEEEQQQQQQRIATVKRNKEVQEDLEEEEDEEDEEDEEEEEGEESDDGGVEEGKGVADAEPVNILQPTKVDFSNISPSKPELKKVQQQKEVKKKSKSQPLKSAHDIVLTESESEEEVEPVVKRDDDISDIRIVKPKSVNQPEKRKDSKKTSGGLLLAFNETPPTKTKTKKKKSENESVESSASSERRKKDHKSGKGEDSGKHKKHKRKSKQGKPENESEEVNKEEKVKDEDPFGFTTSLDAWLAAGEEVM